MKLISLDMPSEPSELRLWLERQIVGRDLHQLVGELAVIHGTQTVTPTLEGAVGADLAMILSAGLGQLSTGSLRTLLTHPQLLFELQERVFIDGQEYWNRVPRDAELLAVVERVRKRLKPVSDLSTVPPSPIPTELQSAAQRFSARRALLWLFPVAAAVAVVLSLKSPPASDWGWDKPGLFAANGAVAEYYVTLEQAAGEFDHVALDQPTQLEKRLREFRHACDTLIEAPHDVLNLDQRLELVNRCRLWSKKLDEHLADLHGGTKPVDEVRTEALATVNALRKYLRGEAEKAG